MVDRAKVARSAASYMFMAPLIGAYTLPSLGPTLYRRVSTLKDEGEWSFDTSTTESETKVTW